MTLALTTHRIPHAPQMRAHRAIPSTAPSGRSSRGAHGDMAAVYRRRRVVAVVVMVAALFMVAMVGAGVLAGPGGVTASASGAGPVAGADTVQGLSQATVVALPGDTMWSIAARYRGEIAHGRYLDALISYNGGASIEAGQVLILP